MMQKVLNVLTVISFGTLTIGTAAGVYVYTQRDAIVENVRGQIIGGIREALPGLIVDSMNGPVPTLPIPDGGTDAASPVPLPVPSLPF